MWLCKCLWLSLHTHKHTHRPHGSDTSCSVGWNQWIPTDSQVLLESVYWLRWRCREVMNPFDLLPLLVANIDPFRQSRLIEESPFFLLNVQRMRWIMVRWFSFFFPHKKERNRWLAAVAYRKTTLAACSLVTVMGTLGGTWLWGITTETLWGHCDFTAVQCVNITQIIIAELFSVFVKAFRSSSFNSRFFFFFFNLHPEMLVLL